MQQTQSEENSLEQSERKLLWRLAELIPVILYKVEYCSDFSSCGQYGTAIRARNNMEQHQIVLTHSLQDLMLT